MVKLEPMPTDFKVDQVPSKGEGVSIDNEILIENEPIVFQAYGVDKSFPESGNNRASRDFVRLIVDALLVVFYEFFEGEGKGKMGME